MSVMKCASAVMCLLLFEAKSATNMLIKENWKKDRKNKKMKK